MLTSLLTHISGTARLALSMFDVDSIVDNAHERQNQMQRMPEIDENACNRKMLRIDTLFLRQPSGTQPMLSQPAEAHVVAWSLA
jgi:hypothetical protein